MRKRAFTLIEVMIVLAIILTIAAITFPVLASAKRAAKRTTTISNLRQCGAALAIYSADNVDERDVPSFESARIALQTAPTCDPDDTWRSSCTEAFGDPLIGSYAYVRGLRFYNDPAGLAFLRNSGNPIIMVSIFFANPPIPMFHGETPPSTVNAIMPTGIIGLRSDGSVSSTKTVFHPAPGLNLRFAWPGAFLSSNTTWVKEP